MRHLEAMACGFSLLMAGIGSALYQLAPDPSPVVVPSALLLASLVFFVVAWRKPQ